MALSFEDIQSQLAASEPSFYTYGKIPSDEVPEPSPLASMSRLQMQQPPMMQPPPMQQPPLMQQPPPMQQPSPMQMQQPPMQMQQPPMQMQQPPLQMAQGGRVVPPEGYPPGTVGSAYEPGSQLPPGVDPMAPIPSIGDPREAAKMMALFSLLPANAFGNMGSVSDPNIAASARRLTDTGAAGGLQGQQFEEGYLEAQRSSPLLGLWQSGLADVLAEDPSFQTRIDELEKQRADFLASTEASFGELKPLSDLLKSNQFAEAFEYAKERGLTDQLMNTENLRNLRGPFSKEEMNAFFQAIPPDVAKQHTGEGWTFDPSAGVTGSLDPFGTGGKGAMESGFPDVNKAFARKDNKVIENIVKFGGGAALLAAALPALAGAGAGAGASAGGAGALTGVVPTGLVPGTAAATAAGASALPTFTVTAGGGLGAGTAAALGAGAAGASALSGGSAAAPTQPTPTPTGQELDEVVVQALRQAPPRDLATLLASTGAGQGVQDILSERQIQEAQELDAEIEREIQEGKLPEEEVLETFRIPGTLPQLDIAEIIPGLASQLAQAGYRAPLIEGQPPPTPETVDAIEEVVVRGQPPVSPIDLTVPLIGGLTAAQIAQGFTQPNVDPLTGELREPLESQQELDKIGEALGSGAAIPGTESIFDKLRGVADKLSTLQKISALLGAIGAGASGRGGAGVGGGGLPPPSQTRIPEYEIQRVQTRPDIDYFTYGTRPEAMFFEDTMRRLDARPPEPEPDLDAGIAPPDEGGPFAMGGLARGGRYYEGAGSGRDDKIPALLSDGEYVMDAETLALLGDGSTKEGAKRMDQFRAKIRKHKGNALSRGRISPNAKSPDKYMGGGLSR